jgi:hypothetical protein
VVVVVVVVVQKVVVQKVVVQKVVVQKTTPQEFVGYTFLRIRPSPEPHCGVVSRVHIFAYFDSASVHSYPPPFPAIQTCNGCVDLNVQRLCYAAQQCSIARCIGSLVNIRRPLCNIGGTGAAVFTTMITLVDTSRAILVETVTTIVGLSLSEDPLSRGVRIRWIDDGFYSAVCSAKDASASLSSILASTVNGVVNSAAGKPVSYVELGAGTFDSNFQAMFSMATSSFINLLNQMALGFFYPLLAMQKVVVCQLNSLTALTDQSGFRIQIGIPAIQEASDGSLGKCLTAYYSENINTPPEGSNLDGFVGLSGEIAAELSKTAVGAFMEILKHPVDAAFTWTIGLLTGVQDVIQTVDMANCKLPDFYMQDVFKCACGDTAYTIPKERADQNYRQGAFWCSGTLNMLGYSQNPVAVFNPYSYSELRARMLGLDAYLACISSENTGEDPDASDTSCENIRPAVAALEQQGVSSIAVLTRCVSNNVTRTPTPAPPAQCLPRCPCKNQCSPAPTQTRNPPRSPHPPRGRASCRENPR